jgi:hypothetical protein
LRDHLLLGYTTGGDDGLLSCKVNSSTPHANANGGSDEDNDANDDQCNSPAS